MERDVTRREDLQRHTIENGLVVIESPIERCDERKMAGETHEAPGKKHAADWLG
jgi:hypothetical protein